jgi:hypothetical protein
MHNNNMVALVCWFYINVEVGGNWRTSDMRSQEFHFKKCEGM